MKHLRWYEIALYAVVLVLLAAHLSGCKDDDGTAPISGHHVSAPEVTTEGAAAGLTLLAGIVALTRGRRAKRLPAPDMKACKRGANEAPGRYVA
jgi:hypothetical protein